MIGHHAVRRLLQGMQQLGLLSLGLIVVDHAAGDVVRRRQLERLIVRVHHGDVAEGVGHGDVHLRLLHQRGKLGIVYQIVGQAVRVLAVDAVAVVAGHHAALIGAVDRGQIHAEGDLVFLERDLLARRLERRASAIALDGVVPQQRQKGHVAARREHRGAGADAAQLAAGHARHIRARDIFKRRFSAQRFDFFIGHAVADNQHILHKNGSSSWKFPRVQGMRKAARHLDLTKMQIELAVCPLEMPDARQNAPAFCKHTLAKTRIMIYHCITDLCNSSGRGKI